MDKPQECRPNSAYRWAEVTLKMILFCLAVDCVGAQTVDVCIVNDASLSRGTIRYVEFGLEAQQKELAAVFRFTCKSDAENAVIIRLRNVPASHQRGDALGAARTENGKVIGQIEVFCDPVRRGMAMRWQSWPALEGWAMATVAAHEMYHYLNNEHDHGHGRLNQKIMNAEALARGFRTVPRMASRSE